MFLCLVLEGNACFLFHVVSGGLLLSDPGEATTKESRVRSPGEAKPVQPLRLLSTMDDPFYNSS